MKPILKIFICFLIIAFIYGCASTRAVSLNNSDRNKDVELLTSKGTMILRLSDSTPLHRDNFLKLVKSKYYDSILFHRVIRNFMIQAGDDKSKTAGVGIPLGNGGVNYTIPAEMKPGLFHKKGALAAARTGDDINPEKNSSGSQFYIVQGRVFTNAGLDSVERFRLKGRKLPEEHRSVYTSLGGTPHLDQNYTVFGELIMGFDVLDSIAATPTSKAADRDRPIEDVRIIRARLIKRKSD